LPVEGQHGGDKPIGANQRQLGGDRVGADRYPAQQHLGRVRRFAVKRLKRYAQALANDIVLTLQIPLAGNADENRHALRHALPLKYARTATRPRR